MVEIGSMTELERRLQKKAEEDRKRAEQIYLAELKTLGENLRRCVRKEADSIDRAMESFNRRVTVALAQRALLSITLGVLLGFIVWVLLWTWIWSPEPIDLSWE